MNEKWASKYGCHRMPGFGLRELVFICPGVCVHARHLLPVSQRGKGALWKTGWWQGSAEGDSTPEVQRAIKSQRISLAAKHDFSQPGAPGGRRWRWSQTITFSWVMNCEMQQKPPLRREGFEAQTAIKEERGKKKKSKMSWENEENVCQALRLCGPIRVVDIMHGSSNPTELLTMRPRDIFLGDSQSIARAFKICTG